MKILFFIFFLLVMLGDALPKGSPNTLLPDIENCGAYEDESYRIYNGEIAHIYDHPWYALIHIKTSENEVALCGGSLINSRFIVTAAHCFDKLSKGQSFIKNPPLSIILGEHDRNKQADCDANNNCYNILNMTASSIFIHERYKNKKDDPSHHNDIALVKLKWPLTFNDNSNLRPVCLPVEDHLKNLDLVNKTLTVTGFGRTGLKNETSLSLIKRKANLDVMGTEECQNDFSNPLKSVGSVGKIIINGTSQICCKGKNKEDTCSGDSGGPVVLNDKYLMGIVSFGSDECGQGKYPTVYTRVSSYMKWIIEKINDNKYH